MGNTTMIRYPDEPIPIDFQEPTENTLSKKDEYDTQPLDCILEHSPKENEEKTNEEKEIVEKDSIILSKEIDSSDSPVDSKTIGLLCVLDGANAIKESTEVSGNLLLNNEREALIHSQRDILRDGDTGIGIRQVVPILCDSSDCIHKQNSHEDKDFSSVPKSYEGEEFLDAEVSCDTSFFDKLQQIFLPILMFITALLGCYITKNMVEFYQSLRAMSSFEIILFSIPIVVFMGILIFGFYKMVRLMFQLRTFSQISSRALEELSERANLRSLCQKQYRNARLKLEELLKEDDTSFNNLLHSIGRGKDSNEWRDCRTLLLSYHCADGEWVKRYIKEYQDKQDELARCLISKYSWKAALAATASPFTALDQIIVLTTCVTMLKDLFVIYNLKPTWDKNLLLMARIVIHVYVTGFWQDFANAGVETLNSGLKTFIDNVKQSDAESLINTVGKGVSGLIGGAVGKVVAKGVGECVMHKITVSRLGTAAIRILQPVGK